MRKFYKYFGTCYLGPMLGMWVSVNPKRLVFFILFLFVTSTFAESSIDEKEDSCSGSIVTSGKNGISVNIEAVVHKECFFTTEIHHYYIRNEDGVVFIKVAPPTKKIQNDEGSVSISHKKAFELRNLGLDRNLNLLIPWNDLNTTKNNSTFENDLRRLGFTIPKGEFYDHFANVKKGQSMIIEIPCLDEKKAREARPFNISNPLYPTLRCEIAPADKDYFSE